MRITADDLQTEVMRSVLLSRTDAQSTAVVRSSDELLAYMAAERAVAVAQAEAARLRAVARATCDDESFLPAWARGRFPFNKPLPMLDKQLLAIERLLAPMSDKRARRSRNIPAPLDDCGNVGSENDDTRER